MVNPSIAAPPPIPEAHEFALGCIKNARLGTRLFDVVLYPSSIVLSKGSRADAALRAATYSGGLLGYLLMKGAADGIDRSRVEKKLALPAAALAAADPANSAISLAYVASAALKKSWTGITRLDFAMTDGSTWQLKWRRTDNNHSYVVQLLSSVLGPRLT